MSPGWITGKRVCAAAIPTPTTVVAASARRVVVRLMAFSCGAAFRAAPHGKCRAAGNVAQSPRSSLLAIHLCVNAVLDFVENRPLLRLPTKLAGALAAHAAIRAEAQIRTGP